MKVLVLSTEFPPGPGGIGTHTQQLASELSRAGWRVTVVAPQDYASPEEAEAFRRGQPFRVVSPGARHRAMRRPDRLRHTVSTIWRARPDVIVASGAGAVVLAGILCRRRPWLAVGHGTEFGGAPPLRSRVIRWAFDRANAVVCVSDYTRARMEAFGVRPRATEVIRNGADRELPSLPGDADRSLADIIETEITGPVVLTVGNVTERKGQEVVIRALPRVLEAVPDAHYVIAGLPTEGPRLLQLARDLGVAERVHFTGRLSQTDLAQAYRDATVLAMTSRHTSSGDFEGFGIAAIEAALFARPAVVSDSGGLPEAVVDGVTGLVVREDDPTSTADALIEVLSNPERAAELGAAARERAARDFTWEAVAQHYDELLRNLIKPSQPDPPRRPRKLVFISDTPHYRSNGEIVGWAATINEIDVLATLFDEVVHITPLYEGDGEFFSAPYKSPRVRLHFVHQAGGDHLIDKFGVLASFRGWVEAIRSEIDGEEDCLIHARGPSALALLALVYFMLDRRHQINWFKYAGNWRPEQPDALSYALHRFLLRHVHRNPVTVNGAWPNQRPHVHTFINPTLTEAQLRDAHEASATKDLTEPIRLLFVGRLYPTKGPDRALEVTALLRDRGVDIHLEMVGDGPMAESLAAEIERLGLTDRVKMLGWMSRDELAPHYAAAHFLLLPTEWEGFPKVVGEAMAFGAVPLAGAVSSIPQMLEDMKVGRALHPKDVEGFRAAVTWYLDHPEDWRAEKLRCYEGAQQFSYPCYLDDVRNLFSQEWGVDLEPIPPRPDERSAVGPSER